MSDEPPRDFQDEIGRLGLCNDSVAGNEFSAMPVPRTFSAYCTSIDCARTRFKIALKAKLTNRKADAADPALRPYLSKPINCPDCGHALVWRTTPGGKKPT